MTFDEAWDILQSNHFKRTKNREKMLLFFAERDRYMTAGELKSFMARENPSISFDTIYRNLTTFTELGILEETELSGERHFRMHCEAGVHHHHFICTRCGKTKNIAHCPMDLISLHLPGYKVGGHKFEVYGKCPNCLAG